MPGPRKPKRNGAMNCRKLCPSAPNISRSTSSPLSLLTPARPYCNLERRLRIPGDDQAVALFQTTQEITEAVGLPAYEISNHARPGAESRHNLIYWRYGDYAGAGPGAHGQLQLDGRRVATAAIRLPERWRDAVARQ